ncbi:HDOD domain-containing protein [uncultured Desulfuromusa sp.]|uniref:HDOD domain-containing protein n=1 Tax=uncultured Desulfuromusa sp. TaxID=219183 RepID=UPI002AA85E6F|nr:HDOD domain-containing protein [uncultured Desulfuromusa sp.]
MSSDPIQLMIEKEIALPSPPAVAVQILNAVQKEEAALCDLVKIISADPALTGKMLQIANSSFYALKNKVSSIDRALSVMGTNVIKNIALSFVIATDFRGEKQSNFNFDSYWRRSVTAAVAADLLSQQLGQKDDDIFVTALLQDIGMLVLFMNKKCAYSDLLQEASLSAAPLSDLERHHYSFDHQQVGAVLTRKWGLPESISMPIGYHHKPDSASENNCKTAAILQFSDKLSNIYHETNSAEKARLLQDELAEYFSIGAEETRKLLDDVAAKSIEILKTFEIEPGDMKPYSQMLQEANDELGKLNLSYEQLVIELKEAKEKSDRLTQELKDINLRLNDLAYYDALTGLFNHRYFQDSLNSELTRAIRYHSSFSLIFFDIDFFKKVNDTFGHPAGDQVLKNVAKEVKKTVRPSDIVARYGGEEFVVILPETDMTGVKVFAARLRRCVEGIITEEDNQQIMVTISLGGTTFDPERPETTKDTLIQTADRALYMSKQNGRNQVTILAAERTPSTCKL